MSYCIVATRLSDHGVFARWRIVGPNQKEEKFLRNRSMSHYAEIGICCQIPSQDWCSPS